MKQSVLIILIAFLCVATHAQTLLKGRVSDTNGNPLVGTSVYLPNQNLGVLCNQEGDYVINNLPIGKVFIQFTYLGYNTEVVPFVVQRGTNVLNIILKETSVEVQEIVVSGGMVSAQRDNAVKIEVLKSESILNSGKVSMIDAITEVPGVDMISRGQSVSKPVIRGLSMNGILVMKDGTRIENYQYSQNHQVGIDDNSIERVEIIKGPASLLYGSDAIGGVLNFISEGPAPQGKISGDYQLQAHSNTLGLNNSLGIKGAPGRFFAGARFNHKTHSDFKQGGGDYVPNSWFNERSVSVNTGCNTNIGTFKLSYYYYMQELGMIYPFVLPLIKERNRRNDIWYQDPHHHLVALQNKLYMGKLRFDINAAWQGNVRRAYAKTPTPFVERRLNTLTYETKIHLPSNEKSDYILGIQGMEQTNRNINNRAKKRIPDADISRFGALFFTQHTFSKLKLQGGLRIDFSSVDSFGSGEEGTEKYRAPVSEHYFSPNGSLGATYRLSDETTLRINFAKACRMPNLRESLVTGLVGSRYEIAGKDLKPEEAYEGDFSFHYNGKSLSLDAAVFYNHIDNYIYLAPSGENTPKGVAIFKTSQNNAKLHGGEAALHYHPLFAHWIHFKTTFSSVIGKQENGEYLPFIPAHKLRYEIGIENESLWIFKQPSLYVSALTAFKQGDPARFETETDGYTIFNVRTNARIKINNQDMLLGLSVNNIMDKKYIDHLSSLKVMNFCNMGRNISISLKVPFGLK